MITAILIGMLVAFLIVGVPVLLVALEAYPLAILWLIITLGGYSGAVAYEESQQEKKQVVIAVESE